MSISPSRRGFLKQVGVAALGLSASVGPWVTSARGERHLETLSTTEEQPFLSPQADWQPQDNVHNQGITAVRFVAGRLRLRARLIGRHPDYSSGEVWLDLRYFPGLRCRVPLDLREYEFTVTVEVPDAFVGEPSRPNGAQIFVKDDAWRSQYSPWVNITSGGAWTIRFRPTLPRIQVIGVKCGIGSGSAAQYTGPLSITTVTLTPPLALSPPPPLPRTIPCPILSPRDRVRVRTDGFYLNGQRWFIVGGNWRLIEYGQNFGATAWFPTGNGIARHQNFVRIHLDYFRRAGLKVIRVGLLDDGRTMFDRAGRVVGYDTPRAQIFRQDVQLFLNAVRHAGMQVVLTLLDYLIAGRGEYIDGVWIRGRRKLITDPAYRSRFLSAFLIPFLQEFGRHPALLGFDFNEFEWLISQQDGGGWEDYEDLPTKAPQPIPARTLRSLLRACCNTIRAYAPGKTVTVGVSAPFIPLVAELPVHYLALHHYPWMGPLPPYLRQVPAGTPWSLEEYPTAGAPRSVPGYLNMTLREGGAGALLWNLSPGIDDVTVPCSERDAMLREVRRWANQHCEEIYTPCACTPGSITQSRE